MRAFYTAALLLPLLGLGLAAVIGGSDDSTLVLGPGGKADWIYPTSAARGLLAYAVVALWLAWEISHREAVTFERRIWIAPVVYVAVISALLGGVVLAQGRAPEFLAEHSGRAALRVGVHLVVGYGYVWLVVFARDRLRAGGRLADYAAPTPTVR
ncbi:MAG: hypothetical protein ACRDSN_14355 [Pseudonocardiaceae bacterium]